MELKNILEIRDSNDLPTFEQRLVSFANNLDFGLASAALVIERLDGPASVLALGNTPTGFSDASIDPSDIKRDPVIQLFKSLKVPFTYDQKLYVERGAADLWEKQAPFGFKTGIAVSVNISPGRHFLVGIDRDKKLPSDGKKLTSLLALVHLLAAHVQGTGEWLLERNSSSDAYKPLTAREVDVLRITSEGKSAWVVGQILSISEFTVNYHMRNIHRKLKTSSKTQAVLKANRLRMI